MGAARREIRTARASSLRLFLALLALALLVLGGATLPARAPPPIPMTTQGSAFDAAGNPLPAGTLIRTFLDGVDYSNDTVVYNAAGGFSVLTAGNLVLNGTTPEPSPVKTGPDAGEPVVYAAGPLTSPLSFFQETTPWEPDLTVTQDLHLASAATTPDPLRIQGLVTQPAQGGPQYVYLCNPTATSLSLSDYYLQVDRPGTYYGGNLTLTGTLATDAAVRVNLSASFSLIPTGDALKVVYRNPGGAGSPAGGRDVVIDRVEFNATMNGTLDWQPGNTIMGDAPGPGPGQILERTSFCSPTPAPSGFALAKEPGLPAVAPPRITIESPTAGQNVQGGQIFTIRWTMTDPVFVSGYLRVWVNVTIGGTTTTVLAGAQGATSVDWDVPDVSMSNVNIHVSAVNPFGTEGNTTTTFNIVPSTPYSVYIAIAVIAVIAAFILIAYYYARRRAEPPPTPPAAPPPEAKPAAPSPPPTAAAPGAKVCPKCGTAVKEADETCFYCGQPLGRPRL